MGTAAGKKWIERSGSWITNLMHDPITISELHAFSTANVLRILFIVLPRTHTPAFAARLTVNTFMAAFPSPSSISRLLSLQSREELLSRKTIKGVRNTRGTQPDTDRADPLPKDPEGRVLFRLRHHPILLLLLGRYRHVA